MRETTKSSPREFFMYFLVFISLYAGVVSFLTLLFQYTNVLIPDPLDYAYGAQDNIRWASSVLIIIFPVFLIFSRWLEKDLTKEPARREWRLRKWLIYFTLFVAGLTVMVDLITLVFNFYGGDLTRRFVFKVLAVLLVASGTFGYYWWDLKREASKFQLKPQLAAWISLGLVAAVLGAGFWVVGSPADQRLIKFDQERISGLQTIQNQIIFHWSNKGELPASLDGLRDSISGFIPPLDPETGLSYGYQVKSKYDFELCANFKTNNINTGSKHGSSSIMPRPMPIMGDNWGHSQGQVCFSRSIDPSLYPVLPMLKGEPLKVNR